MDVAVETTITFKAEEGLRFEWNGLRLRFPIRALPTHLTECSLHIRASLSGQFKVGPWGTIYCFYKYYDIIGGILDKTHLSMCGIDSDTLLVTTEITNDDVIA